MKDEMVAVAQLKTLLEGMTKRALHASLEAMPWCAPGNIVPTLERSYQASQHQLRRL